MNRLLSIISIKYNDMNKFLRYFTFAILLAVWGGVCFTACSDDEESGNPKVHYVRITNPAASDSLLVGAYMGNLIAIIGEDLQNLHELWFNDQKAKLNPAYITGHSVLVSVPSVIPSTVTDQMTFKFAGGQTVTYPFKVLVPAPVVTSMVCEYVPAGEVAILRGNYFLPAKELAEPIVYFPNNVKATEIVSYSMTEIQVVVPEGAVSGPISVESIYGTSRSSFHFRDKTNLILDFETSSYGNPWSLGAFGSEGGPSGQYLRFVKESFGAWSWLNEMMFGYWARSGAGEKPIATGDPSKLELVFEANVPTWSDVPMLIWFDKIGTPEGMNPDGSEPQAHWKPYNKDGVKSTYTTNGWVTVRIPLTDFIYNKDESKSDLKITSIETCSNISFMLFGAADDKYPIDIRIDNVRVVPIN